MRHGLALWLLLAWPVHAAPSASGAPVGPLDDVERPIAPRAAVDWTHGQLEVVGRASPTSSTRDTRPVEQAAIDGVDAALADALGAVPVRPGLRLRSIRGLDLARALRSWRVSETRYHASGQVEVVGAVALHEVLAPWSTARAAPPPEPRDGAPTGVVIDARGRDVDPTWAPAIDGPGGERLFDAVVWSHLAWERAPVVWVTDPAASAAAVAGDAPLLLIASGAAGGIIQLDAAAARRFREEAVGTIPVGSGAVVVVVDP